MQRFWDTKRHDELSAQADKIKSYDLRYEVQNAIESGRVNANDTIVIDKAATDEAWAGLFMSSLECVIACGDLSAKAKKWFATRGIRW